MVTRLLGRSIHSSKKSVLVLGPRQVGKSTLIHSFKPGFSIDLADEAVFLRFSSNPGELRERLSASSSFPNGVFIDEIQRLPSLFNTVQALIDESKRTGRETRFFMTGSSARKLKRGHANLLPGRLFAFEMGPLVLPELTGPEPRFDIRKALAYGTLPEPYLSEAADARELLRNYSGIYLKEEIQSELFIRNLEGFSRFLMTAAHRSGQFLDLSKLAAQAKVPRQSAVRYFEVLEDTLVAHRTERFEGARSADLVKHPRYFFFDPGVLNGILGNFVASPDRIGGLFEHLVFNQIHYTAKALRREVRISSFRTRGGLEIDFVVEAESGVFAVEVKATDSPSDSDLKGLNGFSEYYRKAHQKILVCLAPADRRKGSVLMTGIDGMLKAIFPEESFR